MPSKGARHTHSDESCSAKSVFRGGGKGLRLINVKQLELDVLLLVLVRFLVLLQGARLFLLACV